MNNKLILIIPCGFVLFGMIINVALGWQNVELDLPGVRSLMTTAIIVLIIFNFIKYIQEKRIRLISILPLSIIKVALSRLLYIVFIWTSFMVLYWISLSTAKPYRSNIIFWDTLSVTGLILFVNTFPFFFRDFNFCFKEKYKAVILSILLVLMFFIGYILIFSFGISEYSWKIFQPLLPLRKWLVSVSSTSIGAIIFILIGLGFSVLNILTFVHRKSYIE
ncbi:hypothetical protein H8E88_12820 [candidate division KSB1 bacterium]|nr:hypothetical protein [candidate division KSB1 bacterium]MBL7094850.1 hypothetical protein [candidate division KSB1 bacterium]